MANRHHASGSSSQMYSSHGRGSLPPGTVNVPTMNEHNNLLSFLAVVQYYGFDFLNLKWDNDLDPIGNGANAEVRELSISDRGKTAYSAKPLAFKRHRMLTSPSFDASGHRDKDQDNRGDTTLREKIFNELVAEVTILGHPLIRYHQNIVRLEAVYWETPEHSSEPWPVLVLEKADLGDLWCFASSSDGLELSFEQRLGICLDIGHGLTSLHEHDMIHGDLKPQNVLIFKQEAWKREPEVIYAKLADFGYAAWNMDPTADVAVYLPRSRPWDAPEYHHRAFGMEQAKQLDIFSFGLLCLWLLFHDRLENFDLTLLQRDLDADTAAQLTNLCQQHGFNDVKAVERLKYCGLLPTLARELALMASLCDLHKEKLEKFFSSTLNHNPDERLMCIDLLLAVTGHEASYSIQNLDFQQNNLDHSTISFSVTESFNALMDGKHQVREYIASCLKTEALNGCTISSRQNAAFQYSFCCKIGFGRSSSDEDCKIWLRESGKSVEHLEAELSLVKRHVQFRSPYKEGHIGRMRLGTDKEWEEQTTSKSRQETMKTLIQETEDLASILEPDNHYLVEKKKALVVAVANSGLLDEAEKLILDILEASSTNPLITQDFPGWQTAQTLPPKDRNKIREAVGALDIFEPNLAESSSELNRLLTLSRSFRYGDLNVDYWLAILYGRKRRWKDAEIWLVQARNRLTHYLDESEEQMLKITRDLGIIYGWIGRHEEAVRVYSFLIRLFECGFVKQDVETLTDQASLAKSYVRLGKFVLAESRFQSLLVESARIDYWTPELDYDVSSGLMTIYYAQRRYKDAEIVARERLSFCLSSIGPDNEDAFSAMNNLARVLVRLEYKDEAMKMLRLAIQTQWCLDNQFSSLVFDTTRNLASRLSDEGKYSESETLLQQVLENQNNVYSVYHTDILETKKDLADVFNAQRRFRDAEQLFLPLIQGRMDLHDNHSSNMLDLDWKSALVRVYIKQNRLEEAEKLQLDVLSTVRVRVPANHPKCLRNESLLANIYYERKRYKDSEAMLVGRIDTYESVFGMTHWETTWALATYAQSLERQRRWAEADQSILKFLDMIKDCEYPLPSREWALATRAELLFWRGRWLEAVPYVRHGYPVLDRSWVRFRHCLDRFRFPLRRLCQNGYALAIFLPVTVGLMLMRKHFSPILRGIFMRGQRRGG